MRLYFSCGLLVVLACGYGSCGGDTSAGSGSTGAVVAAGAVVPVTSAGELAAGWSARLDDPTEHLDNLAFAAVDGGFELKPGPNATLWHHTNRAVGSYRLTVGVHQVFSAGMHPHGAGLVFGGSELAGAGQAYTYFLVRGDGQFLIKTRTGGATTVVVPWTEHEAVVPDDRNGAAHNLLTVEVESAETRFVVNGVVVHRAPEGGVPTDGLYGFRLVHDLHVRFTAPVLETK